MYEMELSRRPSSQHPTCGFLIS